MTVESRLGALAFSSQRGSAACRTISPDARGQVLCLAVGILQPTLLTIRTYPRLSALKPVPKKTLLVAALNCRTVLVYEEWYYTQTHECPISVEFGQKLREHWRNRPRAQGAVIYYLPYEVWFRGLRPVVLVVVHETKHMYSSTYHTQAVHAAASKVHAETQVGKLCKSCGSHVLLGRVPGMCQAIGLPLLKLHYITKISKFNRLRVRVTARCCCRERLLVPQQRHGCAICCSLQVLKVYVVCCLRYNRIDACSKYDVRACCPQAAPPSRRLAAAAAVVCTADGNHFIARTVPVELRRQNPGLRPSQRQHAMNTLPVHAEKCTLSRCAIFSPRSLSFLSHRDNSNLHLRRGQRTAGGGQA